MHTIHKVIHSMKPYGYITAIQSSTFQSYNIAFLKCLICQQITILNLFMLKGQELPIPCPLISQIPFSSHPVVETFDYLALS